MELLQLQYFLTQELNDVSSPEYGTIEMAVNTASMLSNILREFRKKKPNIHFHVQMLTTEEMIEALSKSNV